VCCFSRWGEERQAKSNSEKEKLNSLDDAGWIEEEGRRKREWYVGKIDADSKYKAHHDLIRDAVNTFPVENKEASTNLISKLDSERFRVWLGDRPGRLCGVDIRSKDKPTSMKYLAINLMEGAVEAELGVRGLREIFGVPPPPEEYEYDMDWYDSFGCKSFKCYLDSYVRAGSVDAWLEAMRRNITIRHLHNYKISVFIAVDDNNDARRSWLSTRCSAAERVTGNIGLGKRKRKDYMSSLPENIDDIPEHHTYVQLQRVLSTAERDVYVTKYAIATSTIIRYVLADRVNGTRSLEGSGAIPLTPCIGQPTISWLTPSA